MSVIELFSTDFSDEYKTFLRQYFEAQVSAFETSYGWLQWTWKVEPGNSDEWSYKLGLQYGWIPQDPTNKMYPDICSGSASFSFSSNSSSTTKREEFLF